MNNEIKEILDKLKDNDWYEELDLTGTKWIELKQEETNQLLDYITNLQQENEHLRTQVNTYENPDDYTLFYMWLDAKAKDKMKQLQEENERLNNKLEKIKEIINYYAVENEDYSKIYNDEEKELLEVVEGDKNDNKTNI